MKNQSLNEVNNGGFMNIFEIGTFQWLDWGNVFLFLIFFGALGYGLDKVFSKMNTQQLEILKELEEIKQVIKR